MIDLFIHTVFSPFYLSKSFFQFKTFISYLFFFFLNDTATTEIYTLSLHDALPISRVARLMIHTPTAISIFVCLSMVQLMAVFISMRCTLCGHFLQVALTLILVVGYAIAAS